MTVVLVALGAGLGAPLRYLLGLRLDSERFPLGIWLANVLGSALIGFLGGLGVGAHPMALLGTGFCGAFTTYSAFAEESFDRGRRSGSWYAVATIVGALGACVLALRLGEAIAQP